MLPNEPSLRERKGNWYLVFYDPDRHPKQKWVPLKTKDKDTARHRARPLTDDYMRREMDPWTEDPHATAPTANTAVKTYLDARKGDLSERTWRTYKYDLEPFGKRFRGYRLDRVPVEEIEAWCRRGDVSRRTIEKRMTELKTLYAYFADRDHLDQNPVAPLSTPRVEQGPPRYLTDSEYERLVAAVQAYVDAYGTDDGPAHQQAPLRWLLHGIRIAVATGFRRQTLIGLEWKHINTTDDQIVVPPRLTKRDGYMVPLFDRTKRALDRIEGRTGRVLTRLDGSPIPSDTFSKQFTRFAKAASLENVTLHTLRHTFASWLVQAGVSLYKVSAWMGHQDVKVTQRYAHLAPAQSDDIAEQVFG
jgi:integrase